MMDHPDLNRRDFNRLAMSAFGGVVAGTLAGCGEEKPVVTPAPAKPAPAGNEVAAAKPKGEPHGCRGLNMCKGQGASGTNECAGQGDCATKEWHHSCGGAHDCKGKAGCGDTPLQNDCKGQGGCHVPLMASAWKLARENFEKKMEEDGKKVGEAPPPPKKE